MNAEQARLQEDRERRAYWKRWGPYLSERAWGTVREDYSADGDAWRCFPHDHARSRSYRWNEDGLGGICDRRQFLCFALALWNGRDPILKERLFGLSGPEGNHGEDVKECYFYLDSTPTHSWMKFLYKYPQAEFPYARLVEENARRGRAAPEYELVDTGVFDEDRYFDVLVEYAKGGAEDIYVRISITNRGPKPAPLTVLPTLWFRNTWSWGDVDPKPLLHRGAHGVIECQHYYLGQRRLLCEDPVALLFTENETNGERLWGAPNATPYVKDAFHDYVIHGRQDAVNPEQAGTKACARYHFEVAPGETRVIRLRLTDADAPTFADFSRTFHERLDEADEFYRSLAREDASEDARRVMRQAVAGLLWNKQFYHYDVRRWLEGDAGQPPPPVQRCEGRNSRWTHLYNDDIVSMPDKWEYPWYAAWDLAFHCIPFALVDPDYAKDQLVLLLREWYMHPNGQIPAYEWAFGDVNPPVHAWAALRVYQIDAKRSGQGDLLFLERVFHKLLLNFTWWVNRKDAEENNLFEGGFLGMDNIGVFDRSAPLPTGGLIEQSDGTSWMAMFTLNMLGIALELARHNNAYSDIASKFFEHFVHITYAMNAIGPEGTGLWDSDDGFYYDILRLPDGTCRRLKVRSMVGLIPLLAVEILEPEVFEKLPRFKARAVWFINNHPEFRNHFEAQQLPNGEMRYLLSAVNLRRLPKVLRVMLAEEEFLSPYGIRSLSRCHHDHPFSLTVDGEEYRVAYEPAESTTGVFGGNSNWRGPIWFPINYLLIEALQQFDYFAGEGYRVEFPTGSGQRRTLWEVAAELSRRLNHLFLRDEHGRRPALGHREKHQSDPYWRDLLLFHEFFNADTGMGLGASHQTGWTALVAKLLQQSGE